MNARNRTHLSRAGICFLLGVLSQSVGLQSMLESQVTATALMSFGLWQRTVLLLGGSITQPAESAAALTAEVPFLHLFLAILCFGAVAWSCGGIWLARRRNQTWVECAAVWGLSGWCWWLLPGLWEFLRIASFLLGLPAPARLVQATPAMWEAVTVAGWLATLLTLGTRRRPETSELPVPRDSRKTPCLLWCLVSVYVVVYVAMNWQLYRGLLIPHGDSAMYEEHLWNLTHGKGFRSYLDQGLFLGEHIQVVHIFLLPLYLLWPSHLTLELCESCALACGAVPVFWMGRRHTGSQTAALALAAAYLLYFPLQFLDIAIDLKTFRPIGFGIPLFLFALDAFERRSYRSMIVWLLLALSAKEDYALIVAPLGVWIALVPSSPKRTKSLNRFGWGLAIFGTVYLLLVVSVVLPWFRGGAEPHYVRYFGDLGSTPTEIVRTILADPRPFLGKLLSSRSAVYLLMLLLPLGLIPLFSLSRLAVGLPLFGILCLLEISNEPVDQGQLLVPFHHFHAPLIPILFWAAAAGLGKIHQTQDKSVSSRFLQRGDSHGDVLFSFASHFCWMSALALGFFFTLSPLGITFWDRDSDWYWQKLYVPGPRAKLFPKVFAKIPKDACVASTDFVHPRFTHHKRSYDYSHYKRRISNYESKVPDDTDYIVIDTQHRYSDIKRPEDIREYRDHPDQWKLLPDDTDGYFIVLRHYGNCVSPMR